MPMRWLAIMMVLLAAATPDDTDEVLAALRRGSHARDPAGRARAAAMLSALSARPLAGEVDWAARWNPTPPPPYRDRALGPAYAVTMLGPRGHLHLDQIFLAGQRAEVAASADPSLAFDLDVRVAGTRVDCATSAHGKTCNWVPDYTARYSIDLVSRGTRGSRFFIVLR